MNDSENEQLITLASASPQRIGMLKQLDFPILVRPQDVDESLHDGDLTDEVLRIAGRKADACLQSRNHSRWILAVDTAVGIDDLILGKPDSKNEAEKTLRMLQGRTHTVASGTVLIDATTRKRIAEVSSTKVAFSPMDDDEIRWYLRTGEWNGAAGGYRIQLRGGLFIHSLEGSYHNVVGLPIDAIYGMLRSFNYPFP